MKIATWMRRCAAITALAIGLAAAGTAARADENPKLQSHRSKYKVRIDSAPQRAAIYLDDKKYGIVGYTPWEGKLISGSWKIIIEVEGYEPAEKSIRVHRRRSVQDHFIPLVKKEMPAMVEIRADADKNAFGAQAWVDGQLQGTIPVTIKMADGRHLVEIKKPDFETFSQWVEVKEGDRLAIQPMLKAIVKDKFGEIFVESDVPDAEVWLDGNKYPDTTPTVLRKVIVGPHVIEVRKAPAMPWKQTVNVEEGKPTKVRAELKATIGGPSGTVRVLANVDKARVFLDGKDMGPQPLDVKDISPGEHVIEVKAPGYMTAEKRVTVGAGDAQVLKIDLQPEAAAATGLVKVVSRVPEATVYIDGKNVGSVPQQADLPSGDHFVVVEKTGYTKFEKKIRVETGQTMTVSAELKAVGGINVVSTPAGAEILIDGVSVGKTPMKKENIDVGDHILTVRQPNYYNFEKTISVKGGDLQVVQATLEKIDTGPTPGELAREQKGLTSFGARVLPRGRTTVDAYAGYPYFAGIRFTVGAGELGSLPFDAGVTVRTYLSRTEIGVTGRLNLANRDPFSVGVFASPMFGSNFIDDSKRNSIALDTGIMASLSGLGSVTITGAAYLSMWSDRHCPSRDSSGNFEARSTPISICQKAADGTLLTAEQARVKELVGNDPFSRENGARLMLSGTIEIAIQQQWNIWGQFEGAPFQQERAAFVDEFAGPMLKTDIGTYFRLGTTYKF